jgi:hypothetical protein
VIDIHSTALGLDESRTAELAQMAGVAVAGTA